MAKKINTQFKSATCALGNAVQTANDWHADGYQIKWCFPVVIVEEGVHVQAVYMLAERKAKVIINKV